MFAREYTEWLKEAWPKMIEAPAYLIYATYHRMMEKEFAHAAKEFENLISPIVMYTDDKAQFARLNGRNVLLHLKMSEGGDDEEKIEIDGEKVENFSAVIKNTREVSEGLAQFAVLQKIVRDAKKVVLKLSLNHTDQRDAYDFFSQFCMITHILDVNSYKHAENFVKIKVKPEDN